MPWPSGPMSRARRSPEHPARWPSSRRSCMASEVSSPRRHGSRTEGPGLVCASGGCRVRPRDDGRSAIRATEDEPAVSRPHWAPSSKPTLSLSNRQWRRHLPGTPGTPSLRCSGRLEHSRSSRPVSVPIWRCEAGRGSPYLRFCLPGGGGLSPAGLAGRRAGWARCDGWARRLDRADGPRRGAATRPERPAGVPGATSWPSPGGASSRRGPRGGHATPDRWGGAFHLHRQSMNPVMTARFMRAGPAGPPQPLRRRALSRRKRDSSRPVGQLLRDLGHPGRRPCHRGLGLMLLATTAEKAPISTAAASAWPGWAMVLPWSCCTDIPITSRSGASWRRGWRTASR